MKSLPGAAISISKVIVMSLDDYLPEDRKGLFMGTSELTR
jgi:hypothetical protein